MTKMKNKNIYKISIQKINIFILIILVVSVVAHLIVANHAANQRYELAQYAVQSESLSDEMQKIQLRIAELQSSERLNAESNRLKLVKVDSIKYIEPIGPVALK